MGIEIHFTPLAFFLNISEQNLPASNIFHCVSLGLTVDSFPSCFIGNTHCLSVFSSMDRYVYGLPILSIYCLEKFYVKPRTTTKQDSQINKPCVLKILCYLYH